MKIDKVAERKEPMWKRRLQNKIKELRKDLSQLEASKGISNFRHWERLERKYSIKVKRLNVVIEEFKQRITAIAAKVRRYRGRVDSYNYISTFEFFVISGSILFSSCIHAVVSQLIWKPSQITEFCIIPMT